MDNIKRLREDTGAGIMDCKRALEDASGDLERAKGLGFNHPFQVSPE